MIANANSLYVMRQDHAGYTRDPPCAARTSPGFCLRQVFARATPLICGRHVSRFNSRDSNELKQFDEINRCMCYFNCFLTEACSHMHTHRDKAYIAGLPKEQQADFLPASQERSDQLDSLKDHLRGAASVVYRTYEPRGECRTACQPGLCAVLFLQLAYFFAGGWLLIILCAVICLSALILPCS